MNDAKYKANWGQVERQYWRIYSALNYKWVAPSLSHNFLHPEEPFSFFFYNKLKKKKGKKGGGEKKNSWLNAPVSSVFQTLMCETMAVLPQSGLRIAGLGL